MEAAFYQLRSHRDLSSLLDLRPDQLTHYTFGRGRRYKPYHIKKRNGHYRTIWAPASGLKAIQSKLLDVFGAVFTPRDCVHGFVATRSIATNAFPHVNKDWVLNVDLAAFFPSINFGRVRGLFMARPYNLPGRVATILARLCTFQNELPQGSPASPIVSNMIVSRLDSELTRLARRYKCTYSRYADDITISRDGSFPPALADWDHESPADRDCVLGPRLRQAIATNGFCVNPEKLRLQYRDERQIVTGLIVNEIVNVPRRFVRRIRAMLHAWEVYGPDKAGLEHFSKYDKKYRPHGLPKFQQLVKGHIDFLGMIRGTDHPWYRGFMEEYGTLMGPDYRPRPPNLRRPNHLSSWRDAIWVIETDIKQGTAFELGGVGLVTCAHVLLGEDGHTLLPAEVYNPRNPERRIQPRIKRLDQERDVAILEADGLSGFALEPRFSAISAPSNIAVMAAGYPGHARGASLWEEAGTITHIRRFEDNPRYIVSFAIVAGASGSPVMEARRNPRVVGMAKTGVDHFQSAAKKVGGDGDYPDYGVIPVATILGVNSQ